MGFNGRKFLIEIHTYTISDCTFSFIGKTKFFIGKNPIFFLIPKELFGF